LAYVLQPVDPEQKELLGITYFTMIRLAWEARKGVDVTCWRRIIDENIARLRKMLEIPPEVDVEYEIRAYAQERFRRGH